MQLFLARICEEFGEEVYEYSDVVVASNEEEAKQIALNKIERLCCITEVEVEEIETVDGFNVILQKAEEI